ncbi:hypothetical protein JHK84_027802 [Glycine max]|nr:hypothetical protein JHK86_027680 [Glycine max]KAG5151330.1 hypothetical protein JHK84_027802 [Glycine max]
MWLDLSDNALEVISSTFGNLSLEYLDLSLIKFEGSTFREFGAFKSLKTLNLSNNMLVGEVPKELQGLENLQDFQIFNNHLNASTSGSRHCGESDFPLTPWSQTGVHDKNSNSSMEDSDAHKCMLRSHHASDEENAKIIDSLIQSNADSDLLVAFKTGAELLYEIRLLSAFQCITVARFLVENRCDGKATQELARAMKDFPSRHGDKGWESFDYTLLEDCLSFMYYRQSREHRNPSKQRTSVLE